MRSMGKSLSGARCRPPDPYWDQVGRQGFVDSPPPNPDSPDVGMLQGYQPRGPEFWPGLVSIVSSVMTYAVRRSALPYKPSVDTVDPTTGEPPPATHVSVFDNRFLLGLRTGWWLDDVVFYQTSSAQGQAAVYTNAEGQVRGQAPPRRQHVGEGSGRTARIRYFPVPWAWKGRVTNWPQATIRWRTFDERGA